jgi:hypothetical protein
MTEENKEVELPTLEGLDPKQPDYVQKLDEGFTRLREYRDKRMRDYDEKIQKLGQDTMALLKGLEGIVVETVPGFEGKVEEIDGGRAYSIGFSIKVDNDGKRKEADDIVSKYIDAVTSIDDGGFTDTSFIEASVRTSGFIQTIAGLTKVSLLKNTKDDPEKIEFYIPRADGVYVAKIDFESDDLPKPIKDDALKAEDINEQRFASTPADTAVYRVDNPSKVIPLEVVYSQGWDRFERDLAERDFSIIAKFARSIFG